MSQARLSHGSCSTSSLHRVGSLDSSLYWTDDLPVCPLSGIGSATNQIYREDGYRIEEHEFEDRSFHFKVENNTYLYGVFDGHDGSNVSNFATQRMPAELLLGQLSGHLGNAGVEDALRQAFLSVEKAYFDSIDDIMAEKYKLQMDLPEGMSRYEAYNHCPELINRLESVERELIGGTTAVVALIIHNRLFVANCGCCRALLVRTDPGNQMCLRVMQLTVDHDLHNQEERNRLAGIGVNVELLQQVGLVGNHPYTRTMGDYHVKNAYSNIDYLKSAQSDPVIADPEIQGGIELDATCSFLVLMSDGLYKSLETALGTEHANREIASMVATEFTQQSTLNGVAQAVVDKVVRLHHDAYNTSLDHRKQLCQKRDDIMLVVRNFNHPLPNAINSPSPGVSNPFLAGNPMPPLSINIPSPANSPSKSPPPLPPTLGVNVAPRPTFFISNRASAEAPIVTTPSTHTGTLSSTLSSNDSSEGSTEEHSHLTQSSLRTKSLVLDEHGRVEAHVSFSEFHSAFEAMSESQQKAFNTEIELRPEYETINEEGSGDMENSSGECDRSTRL
ncbi:hypothetical protein CAPTEDRAFT_160853 [Capitella teleta]|uniref:TGF-beta-activated kinase 1 and MAP3K7-binding protein 1 n=1 Tax=Capitella teleta TaxID=283909 RepID=R7TEC4_CAPTE|nr:hypothetical protein CAPTEDRAFT_160853 [Capitella teleta]|eukprot:ELT89411.1 hypothetical protein CAPTEDRAFT_160853 [Capitella teleta]